jgi:hypothetical protein
MSNIFRQNTTDTYTLLKYKRKHLSVAADFGCKIFNLSPPSPHYASKKYGLNHGCCSTKGVYVT